VERIAPADHAVLERVLTSSGVERTPVPPESSYLGELVRSGLDALFQGLEKGARMIHVPRQVLIAAVFVAAAVALFLLGRALLPHLLLLGRRAPGIQERLAMAAVSAPAAELDAAGWRAELDRRLSAGLSAEALEAAWWWLARSLAGSRALADWTSRDLVIRAGRPELAALIRRLDAFIYGPRRPAPDEVRGLVSRLEEALT
jgi:hypothetical protein